MSIPTSEVDSPSPLDVGVVYDVLGFLAGHRLPESLHCLPNLSRCDETVPVLVNRLERSGIKTSLHHHRANGREDR